MKEIETGVIELPAVTASTGKFELSAFLISVASAEKLLTPEKVIDPEYVVP